MQEFVRVLNPAGVLICFLKKVAGEIEVECLFFFFRIEAYRYLTGKIILDAMVEMGNSKMQKAKRGPKFVFPPFCQRFICGNCTFDHVQSNPA